MNTYLAPGTIGVRKKKLLSLTAAASILLLTNASQAAVLITFKQEGPDVVAQITGTFRVPEADFLAYDTIFSNAKQLFGSYDRLVASFSGPSGGAKAGVYIGGTVNLSSLTTDPTDFASENQMFGFWGHVLYLPGNDLVPGTAIPVSGSYTWAGRLLADIGAESFSNTLAYTAGGAGGDTISYTTVGAIPEPGTALLLLAGSGLLLVRHRRFVK